MPEHRSPNLQDSIASQTNINQDLSLLMNGGAQLNNPHIKDFNSSFYGYGVIEFKQDKFYWTLYDIDKTVTLDNASKRQYKKFSYDPWWMWLRQI